MPNKVDDFIPYKLLEFIEAKLADIAVARGYNTDPFVTSYYDDARESQAKYTVFLESDGEDPVQQGVGGDMSVQQSQSFVITGVARYETEHPRRLAFALEQDVRTAVHSAVPDIRGWLGRGASFRFSGCTHDGGVLAPYKEAGFRLNVSFTWSQKSDW